MRPQKSSVRSPPDPPNNNNESGERTDLRLRDHRRRHRGLSARESPERRCHRVACCWSKPAMRTYPWIHIPVGYLRCIGNPRTDWRYRTEAEAGLNGRDLLYPRGKVLGGSSSINGMIYMRGQARDYDGWAALTGDEAWSWRDVAAGFPRARMQLSRRRRIPLRRRRLARQPPAAALGHPRRLCGGRGAGGHCTHR